MHDSGIIVVGSGISGLFVALEASKAGLGPVTVLTKGSIDECNTRWAQGGIAAAVGPLDSPQGHLADTIAAGAGLVDEHAARILCMEAPGRIRDLVEHGVAFDEQDGRVALGREAAHSKARVLHAGGDQTGAGIASALVDAANEASVAILDHIIATRVVVERGRAVGIEAFDLVESRAVRFEGAAIVLATGGAGQLYRQTTNPPVATGDGVALAFEAGADLADLEFYQFHPTALWRESGPPFLVSEAVRGEGAILRNAAGEAFMARYHPGRDLAPRDIVARGIAAEMRASGSPHVYLDCRPVAAELDIIERFPSIYATCRAAGFDLRHDPVPVAPAAHYQMGGVRTDTSGRTTIPGLFACGEVACTGVHGANRLASNSLIETVVFGKRIVEDLAAEHSGAMDRDPAASELPAPTAFDGSRLSLRRLAWDAAGIERSAAGLTAALARFEEPPGAPATTREAIETRHLGITAWLLLQMALAREESRGAHFRTDFPAPRDEWQRHQVVRRA